VETNRLTCLDRLV